MLTNRIRYALLGLALAFGSFVFGPLETRGEDGSKAAVFTAMSFKLLSFVDRDGEPLDAANRLIRIGVYDRSGKVLEVFERRCDEHPDRYALVDLVENPETEDPLDMVFVSGESGRRLARVLSRFEGQPVLTVGDHDDHLKSGGIVRFSISRDGKLVYGLNIKQARALGLRINSRLAGRAMEVVR